MCLKKCFKKLNYILLTILIIAILIRIYNISERWGHHDIYFFITSSRAIYDLILTQNTNFWGIFLYNGQGPLFFILSGFFMTIFGLNYVIGAAINIFFSVFSILLVYKICIMFFDRKTGYLSSFLFAILPWQIYLSKTFLIDPTASFFFLLSLYYYIKFIKNFEQNRMRYLLYMGIFIGIGSLFKYYVILACIIIYLHYLFFLKFQNHKNDKISIFQIFKKSLYLILFFLIGLGLLLIWLCYNSTLFYLFNPLELYALNPSTQPYVVYSPPLFIFDFLFTEFTPILFICLIYGMYYCFKTRTLENSVLLVNVVTFSIILYILYFWGITRIYWNIPKYFSPMIPFLCIFSAIGLLKIGYLIRRYLIKIFDKLKQINPETFNKSISLILLISSSALISFNLMSIDSKNSYNLNKIGRAHV